MHNFDHWSGRALPSPGEDNRGEGGGHGRARLEGGGQGLMGEGTKEGQLCTMAYVSLTSMLITGEPPINHTCWYNDYKSVYQQV